MPRKSTVERAKKDKRQGKAPTTQAGEFVREEMDKLKHGQGAPKNRKQAIAIGLSEARRSGVAIPDNPRKKKAAPAKKKAAAKKKSR